MPSYTLKPKNKYHTIYIGWDDQLSTYFLHVIDESEEEDSPMRDLLWIGAHYGEVHDIEVILEKVAPYADVPAIIQRKIYADANA